MEVVRASLFRRFLGPITLIYFSLFLIALPSFNIIDYQIGDVSLAVGSALLTGGVVLIANGWRTGQGRADSELKLAERGIFALDYAESPEDIGDIGTRIRHIVRRAAVVRIAAPYSSLRRFGLLETIEQIDSMAEVAVLLPGLDTLPSPDEVDRLPASGSTVDREEARLLLRNLGRRVQSSAARKRVVIRTGSQPIVQTVIVTDGPSARVLPFDESYDSPLVYMEGRPRSSFALQSQKLFEVQWREAKNLQGAEES